MKYLSNENKKAKSRKFNLKIDLVFSLQIEPVLINFDQINYLEL